MEAAARRRPRDVDTFFTTDLVGCAVKDAVSTSRFTDDGFLTAPVVCLWLCRRRLSGGRARRCAWVEAAPVCAARDPGSPRPTLQVSRRLLGQIVDVYSGMGTHDTLRVKLRASEQDIQASRIR